MGTGNFPSPLLCKDWNCHQQWPCPRIKPLTEMDGTVQTSLRRLFLSRLSANSCSCLSIRHLNFQTLQSNWGQKLLDEKARGNQRKMRIWKNSACQKRPAVHHHCTCAAPVPCLRENIRRENISREVLLSSAVFHKEFSCQSVVKVWSGTRFFTALDILSKVGSVSCFAFLRKRGWWCFLFFRAP